MATIYQIRRDNLRQYLRDNGGPKSAAKLLGYANASYLSHLAGPTPTREMKEETAREFEQKLTLPVGWFDTERDMRGDPIVALPIRPPKVEKPEYEVHSMLDSDRLTLCLQLVADLSAGKLSMKKHSELVTMAYEEKSKTPAELKQFVERMLRLAL